LEISSVCKSKTPTNIDKLSYNNKDLTKPLDICNALNNYFGFIGRTSVFRLVHILLNTVCSVTRLLVMKLSN